MKRITTLLLLLYFFISAVNINSLAKEYGTFEYVLPVEFSRVDRVETGLGDDIFIAYDNLGKCATYDLSGKKLSQDYDYIDEYNKFFGVALAKDGGVFYVIDHGGNICGTFDKPVIAIDDVVFVDLSDNNDGRSISYYEGNFGVYSYWGEEIMVLPYDKFLPSRNSDYKLSFSHDRLIFREGDKFGAINSDNLISIPAKFDKIYPFPDNYTWLTIAVKDGKYGLIDLDGNTVIDFLYDYISPMYENGKICAYSVEIGGLHGLYSKLGDKLILSPSEAGIEQVYMDYSLIKVSMPNTRDDKEEYPRLYGLVDFSGNTVIPIEHNAINYIYEGIIDAEKSYDHEGYYDLLGNEITEFKYRMCSPFSDGLAVVESVKDDEFTCEVINRKGEVQFAVNNWMSGFFGGVAYSGNGRFVDKTGETVIYENTWTSVFGADWWNTKKDGIFIVGDNGGAFGVIKYNAPIDLPLWGYEYIDFRDVLPSFVEAKNGYVFTRNDQSEIFVDKDGNVSENGVEITGRNVSFFGDAALVYDNSNNIILTLGMDVTITESKNYICTVTEGDVPERQFRIYSKEDGKLLLDTKYENFQNTGMGCVQINDNGYFAFHDKDYKYGVADVNGKIIADKAYDYIEIFSNDLFKAKFDNKWSIIDETGNVVAELLYSGEPFKYENTKDKYTVIFDEYPKVLDENYDLVYECHELNRTVSSFDSENAIVLSDTTDFDKKELVSLKGDVIVPLAGQSIDYLGENVFSVDRYFDRYLINTNGKIIASNCSFVTDMGDNGYIGVSQGNYEGYINSKGERVLTLKNGYYVQGAFSEGMAAIVQNIVYGRYGDVSYINEQGAVMLSSFDSTWCSGGEFKNGLARVGVSLGHGGPDNSKLIKCTYDAPSDWAKDIIQLAIDEKLVPESQRKRYRQNINREDFCEIAYELPQLKEAIKKVRLDEAPFYDTPNAKIFKLSDLGIIKGKDIGVFAPEDCITREEAAVILERIYSIYGEIDLDDYVKYDDDEDISDWARDSVYFMRKVDIMQGTGTSEFSPKKNFTKEQAIATILRLF